MGKSTELEETHAEGQNQSNSETSPGEHRQSSSQEAQLVASLLESKTASAILDKMVDERAAKYLQSNKDKRFQTVDDNTDRLDRLEALVDGKGMSFEDAKAQIQAEDRQSEIETTLNAILEGQAVGGSDIATDWTERETAILASQGINANDPELKRFKAKFDDPSEYIKQLPNKAWQMSTRPEAGEGSASGGQGTSVDEDLEAEYLKELATIRRGDIRAIDALKRKYRGLGLPVY